MHTHNGFSVFKVKMGGTGSPKQNYVLALYSASTSESLEAALGGMETNALQDTFADESCKLEIMKETDGRTVTFSVRKGDDCQPNSNERNIWSNFDVKLIDNQGRIYEDYTNSGIMKEYINKTGTQLTVNGEKMLRDGLNLVVAYFQLTVNAESTTDIVHSYVRKMYLTQSN